MIFIFYVCESKNIDCILTIEKVVFWCQGFTLHANISGLLELEIPRKGLIIPGNTWYSKNSDLAFSISHILQSMPLNNQCIYFPSFSYILIIIH